jgi:hypothetical protein
MTSAALIVPDRVAQATLPVTYERAKTALAACVQIDECKDWADKAAALASYAKQADDKTLHNFATRISARAIRRAGDLLREFQSLGGRPSKTSAGTDTGFSQRDAAAHAGMSKRQEVTAIRVANVPEDEFELLVESDTPPTVTALAERGKSSRPARTASGFIEATQAIGLVRRFVEFTEVYDAAFIAGGVTAAERPVLMDRLHVVRDWLEMFRQQLQEAAR